MNIKCHYSFYFVLSAIIIQSSLSLYLINFYFLLPNIYLLMMNNSIHKGYQKNNTNPNAPQVNVINPLYESCKVMMFSENQQFSMDIVESQKQVSSENDFSSDQPTPITKKVNFVKGSLMMSKKRSISIQNNDESKSKPFQLSLLDNVIKSENSFFVQDQNGQNKILSEDLGSQNNQKISDKHPAEEQLQSYFVKKVRVLESKFKKYKLDSETEIMKLKNENKSLKLEISKMESQLYPDRQSKIQAEVKNMKMVNFDDSSSEDSMNDEKVMPVFSQIMEVKLEGKKLCDKIKMLEKTFKLEKSTNLKMKEKIQKMSIDNGQKGFLNRKWSIQELIRYKKESFQLSKISTQAKEGKLESEIEEIKNPKKCKKCEEWKLHLLKLNQGLRKIQIN